MTPTDKASVAKELREYAEDGARLFTETPDEKSTNSATTGLVKVMEDELPNRLKVLMRKAADLLEARVEAPVIEDVVMVPRIHRTEIKKGNLGYLSPKCSCGWEGGCWASYENARREIYEHEIAIEKHVAPMIAAATVTV